MEFLFVLWCIKLWCRKTLHI